MLKTLKWVYDLGIKQERQRIARALEGQLTSLNNEYGMEHDMLRNMPATGSKQRKNRLELKHAVTMRVSEIVNNILEPRYEDRGFIFSNVSRRTGEEVMFIDVLFGFIWNWGRDHYKKWREK